MVTRHRSILILMGGMIAILLIAGVAGIAIARFRAQANAAGTATPSALQQELGAGIDPGSSLNGTPAPDFTLTDQFGRLDSLHQFRGKVAVLAFTDSECTTICPLTSQSLLDAVRLLPPSAAQHVQLLGLDASPTATSVADVRSYSIGHGLENKWLFLTGTPTQLGQVWKAYHIYVQIAQGAIDHTPAVFVIGPNGDERTFFETSGQYGVVGVEAYALASAMAPLLPGHVHVQSQLPPVVQLTTTQPISLPAMTAQGANGTVTLGPGRAQLVFFFAFWAPDIQQELVGLNQVAQANPGLRVVAVDVGSTEAATAPPRQMLRGLSHPLIYPVALDQTGNVADAYHVQDIPWFTLTTATGTVVGSHDGWVSPSDIAQSIQMAMHTGP